jgi:uncharacterized protein (TIGR02646 family)
MIKIVRLKPPTWLAENWQRWGREYEIKRENGGSFSWTLEGIDIRAELLTSLRKMTSDHCSYCDGFPMESMLGDTIDHFKPKSLFPRDAYSWENLFLCCYVCQKRLNEYEILLVRPDFDDYSFESYFVYNTENGEVEPNSHSNVQDQERARYTIKVFKLNDFNRPNSRKMFFRKFINDANAVIDEYPFRFLYIQ